MQLHALSALASQSGLALRGAFHPDGDDDLDALENGAPRTLVLLGWIGGRQWPAFAASPEAEDGAPDPLDRWSRRVIDALAAEVGATALYPFGGPPWHPFQRWAMRAEPVSPSPLGILIHPDWGLWHSYRGALAFAERLDVGPVEARASPCASCAAKPCLSACPVGAFRPAGYDVAVCAAHAGGPDGAECRGRGCLARRACPVAADMAYGGGQVAFHMRAFLHGKV